MPSNIVPSSSARHDAAVRDAFRPGFYLAFGDAMRRFCRVWFRYTLRGCDRIPERPTMFVGNHSGIGIAEALCMLGAWRTRFGLHRRVVAMMHDAFVAAPIVGWFARGFGSVNARPENARAAFAAGHDVAVFPGGDLDSCRPFTEARQVHFGPRRGYVRIALEHSVPIVPIATIGSHYSYLLLPGGERLARWFGTARWLRCAKLPLPLGLLGVLAATVLAVTHVASPAWIAVALVALVIPNPVTITSEMLPAIDVAALTAHIADPSARVEAAHELVLTALRNAVGQMKHDVGSIDTNTPSRPVLTEAARV